MSDNTPFFDKLVREYAERGTRYTELVKPIPTSNPWLDGFRPAEIIEEIEPHTVKPLHARVFGVPACIVEDQIIAHLGSPEPEEVVETFDAEELLAWGTTIPSPVESVIENFRAKYPNAENATATVEHNLDGSVTIKVKADRPAEVLVKPFVPVEGQPRGSVVASKEAKIAVRQSFFEERCQDGTTLFQPVYYLPPFDGRVFAEPASSPEYVSPLPKTLWEKKDGVGVSAGEILGMRQDDTEAFRPVFRLPEIKSSSPFDRLPVSPKDLAEGLARVGVSADDLLGGDEDRPVFGETLVTSGITAAVEDEKEFDFSGLFQKFMDDTMAKFQKEHPNGIITGFGESKMEEDGSYTITVEGMEIADPEMAKRFTPRPHKSVATQPGEFEAGGMIFMDNEYQDAVNTMAPYKSIFDLFGSGHSEE